MKAKQIIIVVLVVIGAILIIQNSMVIPFRILFWSTTAPIFFLALSIFAVGLIIGYLVARLDRKKKSKPESGRPDLREAKESPISGAKPGSSDVPGSPDPGSNPKK